MNKNEEMFTEYQYGFSDKDVSIFKTDKGLTKEIVKTIPERKEEPKWMLEYRLNALKEFYRMPMPTWGGDLSEIDFEDLTYYVNQKKQNVHGMKYQKKLKILLKNLVFQKLNKNILQVYLHNMNQK